MLNQSCSAMIWIACNVCDAEIACVTSRHTAISRWNVRNVSQGSARFVQDDMVIPRNREGRLR